MKIDYKWPARPTFSQHANWGLKHRSSLVADAAAAADVADFLAAVLSSFSYNQVGVSVLERGKNQLKKWQFLTHVHMYGT